MGTVPDGYIRTETHPDFKFGLVVYKRPLDVAKVKSFELMLIPTKAEIDQVVKDIIEEMQEYAGDYLEDYEDDPRSILLPIGGHLDDLPIPMDLDREEIVLRVVEGLEFITEHVDSIRKPSTTQPIFSDKYWDLYKLSETEYQWSRNTAKGSSIWTDTKVSAAHWPEFRHLLAYNARETDKDWFFAFKAGTEVADVRLLSSDDTLTPGYTIQWGVKGGTGVITTPAAQGWDELGFPVKPLPQESRVRSFLDSGQLPKFLTQKLKKP